MPRGYFQVEQPQNQLDGRRDNHRRRTSRLHQRSRHSSSRGPRERHRSRTAHHPGKRRKLTGAFIFSCRLPAARAIATRGPLSVPDSETLSSAERHSGARSALPSGLPLHERHTRSLPQPAAVVVFAAALLMMLTVGVMVDALMTMMTTELAIGVVVSGKFAIRRAARWWRRGEMGGVGGWGMG